MISEVRLTGFLHSMGLKGKWGNTSGTDELLNLSGQEKSWHSGRLNVETTWLVWNSNLAFNTKEDNDLSIYIMVPRPVENPW